MKILLAVILMLLAIRGALFFLGKLADAVYPESPKSKGWRKIVGI